ncbi:MAG: alpha-amylase/alpha-mannosidase [Planctomycetes bacterium]|nr:alpha-amylase/alpha-mannosidase [Planctomycetota bacterium]
MQKLALAFLWHQHQPYYPDDVGSENPMPWVRLHGVKDYYGMALHLKEVPEFRCTINLVPSLLAQLKAYTERGASDTHLDLSRRPADSLSQADSLYLLDNFFLVHSEQMIRPHRRYYELYLKRNAAVDSSARALRRYSKTDLRDLQVWWNLTWVHPLVIEQDRELQELQKKDRHYSEAEKNWLLDRHVDILRRIIPLHRELADSGQIELTTTPYYHPILPLLWDKRLAREAMPQVSLPRYLNPYVEDGRIQIQRAVAYHQEVFGGPPRGMWPSEGSVCPQMVPALVEAGIGWIATDEEILAQSTEGRVGRDSSGHVRHPELLYRPWRFQHEGRSLAVVFRDHGLSDLLGFHYQRTSAARAVEDFVHRLELVAEATRPHNGDQPPLVAVILDGENCWEYYPGGGVDFLRLLYRRCASHPGVQAVRVRDHLEAWPATESLPRLASGSWIQHNFAIWIGDEEDNRAWDLLHETREHLRQVEQSRQMDAQQVRRAWEEIYIAEGSDWFWWFGDSHSSAQDSVFDRLFRKHLLNVYMILGEQAPAELQRAISRARRRSLCSEPKGFLDVTVDGRRTFFEWINAGQYRGQVERGTMAITSQGLIKQLYYGFDPGRLLLRIDTNGPARRQLQEVDTLQVVFLEPAACEVVVSRPAEWHPMAKLYRGKEPLAPSMLEVATDQIVEMAIPFGDLQVREGRPLHFFVELWQQEQSLDRAPREGAIEMTVPSPDYEQIMWQA